MSDVVLHEGIYHVVSEVSESFGVTVMHCPLVVPTKWLVRVVGEHPVTCLMCLTRVVKTKQPLATAFIVDEASCTEF